MNNDPKIVLLLPFLPHYRKEFVEWLAEALRSEGYTLVCVVGQNRLKKEVRCVDDAGCEVVVLHSDEYRILGAYLGIQRGVGAALRAIAPAKVVCLHNPGNLAHARALWHCMRSGIPFVIWGCSYERPDANFSTRLLRRAMRKFFLKRAAGHIAYGSERKYELMAMGISKHLISIAQNTVNVERITAAANAIDKAAARNACGIPKDAIIALHVGALISRKRLDAMVEVLARSQAAYPEMLFYIVGNGDDRPRLEAFARQMKVADRVRFVGARYDDELARFFKAADFFVMPGTGGLAVNEAMAYGLPVIAAHGDGTVIDLIEHRKTGYLLKSEALIEDLSAAVEWATQAPPERASEIQQRILAVAPLRGMVTEFTRAICADSSPI